MKVDAEIVYQETIKSASPDIIAMDYAIGFINDGATIKFSLAFPNIKLLHSQDKSSSS